MTEEIIRILWSYRTTHKEATGETPYQMAYDSKGVIPSEVQMGSLWLQHFEKIKTMNVFASH